jgi:hypothetical protein
MILFVVFQVHLHLVIMISFRRDAFEPEKALDFEGEGVKTQDRKSNWIIS